VLVLPSAHQGGELIIRHAGREAVMDMSCAELSELGFAAFYADCEHEVRPITHDNRVCLVYNLVQRRGAKGAGMRPRPPEHQKTIAAAASLIERLLTGPAAPVKMVWLLEHEYTPAGLAFSALKSADAAKAQVLVQAADRAHCATHLGVVHIEETGIAEFQYSDDYWGYGDEEESGDDFEPVEVTDSWQYVDEWRDMEDRPAGFGEIPIAPDELLPAGALDNATPDERRATEATGHEGASFERSYHRAAVVLWRRERHAEVLLQAGVEAAMPLLRAKPLPSLTSRSQFAARAAMTIGRSGMTRSRAAP
jgi:hypothetical protein